MNKERVQILPEAVDTELFSCEGPAKAFNSGSTALGRLENDVREVKIRCNGAKTS